MNDPYSTRRYNKQERWINYWYQIDNALSFNPNTILEIGTGSRVVYDTFKKLKINVASIDINADLKPDVVGSVCEMPFQDNSFDVVLAAEILEHIPFTDFKQALSICSSYA